MFVDGGGFWETAKLRNLEAIPLDDQVCVSDHNDDCDDDECDDGDDDDDLVLQGAELNLAMQTKRSPSLSDSTGNLVSLLFWSRHRWSQTSKYQ